MEPSNQFQYMYTNLFLYHFNSDWIMALGSVVAGLISIVAAYHIIRICAIYSIGWHIDRVLAHKKKTLGDLILMKDIQTELEKEIEQAILKAAFHS